MVGDIDGTSKDESDDNSYDGGDWNLSCTRIQKEGDKEDTAFSHLTPNIPCNVETDFVQGKVELLWGLGILLLPGEDGNLPVHAEPLWDLHRQLDDANGRNDLGDTLDDFNDGFIQFVTQNTERDSNRDDNDGSNEGGK